MKRAVAAQKPSATSLVAIAGVKPVRKCTRNGCDNVLKPVQKKYCSAVCKNLMQSTGINGGQEPKYRKEFAKEAFKAYLDDLVAKNKPDLIPTESSYIVIHNAKPPTKDGYRWFIEEHYGVSVTPQTFDNWEKAHYEFGRAMDELMRRQKEYLLNNGLAGRYNPQISKLVLSANHGMIERTQVDNTHKLIGIVKHVYQVADQLEQGHGN